MIQESRIRSITPRRCRITAGVYCSGLYRLGAPYWDMYAAGHCGITRGTTQNHIIRAAEESIAYQSYDLVHAMELDVASPSPP